MCPNALLTKKKMKDCLFCNPDRSKVLVDHGLSYSILDEYPVTGLHCLIISSGHCADYLRLTQKELLSCHRTIKETWKLLIKKDPTIRAFNLGTNAGTTAGQTIFHFHYHLIPRRLDDVDDPRGGVRHIIPGKGYY